MVGKKSRPEFKQWIKMGPALLGESLVDFPVLVERKASYSPLPEERVQFSFALDEANEQRLTFTTCPGHQEIFRNGEFCAYVHIPLLSCEEEITIWLLAGEGTEGHFVEPKEFWVALGYAYEPGVPGGR